MARQTDKGEPRVLACAKHPDKTITLYDSPQTIAWCPCGSQMREPATSSSNRAPRRTSSKKGK